MKTPKEWYNSLSPEDRVNFNQNCNLDRYLFSPVKVTLYSFINGAFLWNATKQGHDYWYKIANSNSNTSL